jgi:hypothetical protein
MKMNNQAVLYGIKSSKGDFNGMAYDSTTFHLSVDIGESSNGESMGLVTRPFKCGTSEEYKKWAHLKAGFPVGGIPCDCEFDVVAGSDQSVKLTLLSIKPTARKPAAA